MVMDKDDAGQDQYLLVLGYDHYSMRSLSQRLAYARHIGGEEEPTLLSRPVFVETCGPEIGRWSYSARLFGYPHGFVSIGPDCNVWIHDSEEEYGARLFRKKLQIGHLSTPDEVTGPVNLAVADLDGNGIPDLIGGCFCGFPDDYFPKIGNKTDNTPWSEIVNSRFDENGKWRGGKERGFLYRFKNLGTARNKPRFEGNGTPILDPEGNPIEFFGVASACPVDFDGDGDTDLICGQCDEHLHRLPRQSEKSQQREPHRGH